jgi:hypothetical protein
MLLASERNNVSISSNSAGKLIPAAPSAQDDEQRSHAGRRRGHVWVTPDMRADIGATGGEGDRAMSAWIELALRRAIEEAKRKK